MFLMEIPPFRRPRLGHILVRSLFDRTLKISLRALCVAAPAGAVLWIMGNTGALEETAAFLEPVGKLLGMTQRKVSYLERGQYEPSLQDIKAICTYFKVSADYLLGFPKPLPYPKRK